MIVFCLIVFILIIGLIKYLIDKRKRDSYLKAGEKWDGIVEELRKRK
tara:strand:- start:199 stop:339 length:141 start_codon:yes stop_codon:yes gene_type:complete